MAQRVWSTELACHVGESVTVCGWLHRLRRLSAVAFLILRDGQGLVQVVLSAAQAAEVASILPESVIRIGGTVVANASNTVTVRPKSDGTTILLGGNGSGIWAGRAAVVR